MEWLERSLKHLTFHFRKVLVYPPEDERELGNLSARFGNVPDDLTCFYTHCGGIRVGLHDEVVGHIYSVKEALHIIPFAFDCEPERRFFPVRGDGCGDYDCVVLGQGVCEGSVVFWDHEVYEGPAYLLGGTFSSYFQMWADHLITEYLAGGEKDQRFIAPHLDRFPWAGIAELTHPWPFDESWMKSKDSTAAEILNGPDTRRWLLRQDNL